MQKIIVEKPYQFLPPYRGMFWPTIFRGVRIHDYYLRKSEGVVAHEVRHVERLRASLAAGDAVLITPNHPRTADPLAMGWLAVEAPCHFHVMASWHLFQGSRVYAWAIRAMGGFSVNREGVDRQAINTAIELLAEAKRPLVIFPEGATSRTADHLHAMLDGVAFIARAAAKKRAKQSPPGKVVVHPVAVKYFFGGDIRSVCDDVLTEIEHRLTWQPQRHLPLVERLIKVGSALLSLKEIEYLGKPQAGGLGRAAVSIDRPAARTAGNGVVRQSANRPGGAAGAQFAVDECCPIWWQAAWMQWSGPAGGSSWLKFIWPNNWRLIRRVI